MPKGIPLTAEEQARRRYEICQTAVHLFLERGFNETTMREIAESAGVGKSTLYDYFHTKDEILLAAVEAEVDGLIGQTREIAGRPIATQEKLNEIISTYLAYLAAKEDFYLKLTQEMQRLPQSSLQRINKRRHLYQDIIRGVIEAGIGEGLFRRVDPLLATRVILSALSPAVYANRRSGTPEQMVQDALALILNGLLA